MKWLKNFQNGSFLNSSSMVATSDKSDKTKSIHNFDFSNIEYFLELKEVFEESHGILKIPK